MKKVMMTVVACFCLSGQAHAKACEGIFPKNNLWIGTEFAASGITQAEFDAVLDKIVAIYNPIVKNHGYTLQFNRLWSDGTVNSDTDTEGNKWVINSYGGLARYAGITMDAYAGVACHELGHHLGGAPTFSDGSDMSVEGEADYHTAMKCLRKYFAGDNNAAMMAKATLDPMVIAKCTAAFAGDNEQIAICERASVAGYVLADILRQLEGAKTIAFNTPDTHVVKQTFEDHPAAQCRLDTYFESALCPVSDSVEFSLTDYKVGACTTGDGARSRCWFAP